MKCPKTACERGFCHVAAFAFFLWNAPKLNTFIFVFSRFIIRSRGFRQKFWLKMPHFLCSKTLKCTIFPIWFSKWPISNGAFQMFRSIESGVFQGKHVTSFWNKKSPKIKSIDFWAFRENANAFTCIFGHFMVPLYKLYGISYTGITIEESPVGQLGMRIWQF